LKEKSVLNNCFIYAVCIYTAIVQKKREKEALLSLCGTEQRRRGKEGGVREGK